MSTSDLITFFVDDSLKSCGTVLLLVVAYKLHKLKGVPRDVAYFY